MRRHLRPPGLFLGALAVTACFTLVRFCQGSSLLRAQDQSSGGSREEARYVKPEACAPCHRAIWETYQRTGMARSFSRPSPANKVEDYGRRNTFYHKPSESYFSMLERAGKFYQRRYQVDLSGKQVNVMEKQVDFIMGSGNHARTYLHKTERGTLIEMPLGWYAEKGGYWGMNPGYDRPDHEGFRRSISYDCMFCHNGYPQIPAGHDQPFAEPVYREPLPEGIDCQRCHGPGGRHVRLATAGARSADIHNSIVNPSHLSTQRQMEVCLVCHLETTSFPLPNAIQRYERGPFSYKPGEPMEQFILTFDHAPGGGREKKFEIVSAAYRLRQSACYLKSNNKLLCTTCHNPHDVPHGQKAEQHYASVCRQCHASTLDRLAASGKHSRSNDCVGCHMPKRRTEDVVHAAVTDHYIQRYKPAGDLLAELPERHETIGNAYRGPVVLYYPENLPHTPENDLYLAVAQVKQGSNLREGITQLASAIERHPPGRAEFYFELAEAWRESGDLAKAIPLYRESIRRNPNFVPGMQKLGFALRRSGQYAEAGKALKQGVSVAPDDVSMWLDLGLAYKALGNKADAVAAFERVLDLDAENAEAQNNVGFLRLSQGEPARAEPAFREAIRIRPDYADAHGNLGSLLSASGNPSEAVYHFEAALRLRPDDAATRYNYAVALGRLRRFDEAQQQLELSLRTDPELADAHELLGDLLTAKNQVQAAVPHYREAVRLVPGFARAELGLGSALAALGDVSEAIPHLQKAAAGSDPGVRAEAARMLQQFGKE